MKDAHGAGVLRPCLRGTVECRYHEREDKDTRPRNPGKYSPNVPIASASRAPAPSSAGEAVTDLGFFGSAQVFMDSFFVTGVDPKAIMSQNEEAIEKL